MVYELRIYKVAPGRMGALHKRFVDHALRLFDKHGMQVVGFWMEAGENADPNTLYYMLAFEDLEDMERKWKEFQADQEWQTARAESIKDGPITVPGGSSTTLAPTSYSPLQ